MRSLPTSSGLRYLILSPVRTPGSSRKGRRPKYFKLAFRTECTMSGTTEQIATAVIAAGSTPFSRSTCRPNRPISSEVFSARVVRRNCNASRSSSNTPP
jgi:hypothetical protein